MTEKREALTEAAAPLLRVLKDREARGLTTVLAIDGPCGSGKTSLAALLSERFGAPVIHADDFFLPLSLRSEERMALPLHVERLRQEVLPGLASGAPLSYRRFDHGRMDVGEERVEIPAAPLRVLEGSYCLTARLGPWYDLAVFCKAPREERLRRLRLRCRSEAQYRLFLSRWIPTEDAYFLREDVEARCDFVLSNP